MISHIVSNLISTYPTSVVRINPDQSEWVFTPGQLEMERYTPGMVHLMPRGVAKQYKMHEGCWALEYARGMSRFLNFAIIVLLTLEYLGWIPLMLPFGFADGFTSTLDIP